LLDTQIGIERREMRRRTRRGGTGPTVVGKFVWMDVGRIA